ncbi:sugar phosphate isomerase/epimerase [candidate division KSB1 bacterium]|nr:sugar phosphate isomerase/epimerase [candidate division KSB1 bacterium]MBL7093646.1 sugar phosphate isomerase/epimerase [candidate division KSB1 bacterium]
MSSKKTDLNRRKFIGDSAKAAAGIAAGSALGMYGLGNAGPGKKPGSGMKFGLVTYLWGKDWDLPTLIRNCETAGVYGVELRVEHAHSVHAGMNKRQRFEVKLRFENSPVTNLGMGCNWAFHYKDKERLKKEIEGAKEYLLLSRDTGGSGIKVKPNGLPEGVPPEKTLEQIGKSLNVIGKYAADLGQVIRVEVHGRETQKLPNMKKIFDHVTEKNVGICWNCNNQDLDGKGLDYNFNLVKDRFGDTVHCRELGDPNYPYQKLIDKFVTMDYKGWILLEARAYVLDRVIALKEQNDLFNKMVAKAQEKVG